MEIGHEFYSVYFNDYLSLCNVKRGDAEAEKKRLLKAADLFHWSGLISRSKRMEIEAAISIVHEMLLVHEIL